MSFSARNAEGKSNGYNVRIVEKQWIRMRFSAPNVEKG